MNAPTIEELLPCPFCGGTNIGEASLSSSDVYGFRDVFGCRDCDYGFEPNWGNDIPRWNTRAPSPARIAADLLADFRRQVKNETLADIMDAATIPRFAGGGLRDLVEHVRTQESDHDPLAEALKLPEVAALVDAVETLRQEAWGYGSIYETAFHAHVHDTLHDALAPFTAAKETP